MDDRVRIIVLILAFGRILKYEDFQLLEKNFTDKWNCWLYFLPIIDFLVLPVLEILSTNIDA